MSQPMASLTRIHHDSRPSRAFRRTFPISHPFRLFCQGSHRRCTPPLACSLKLCYTLSKGEKIPLVRTGTVNTILFKNPTPLPTIIPSHGASNKEVSQMSQPSHYLKQYPLENNTTENLVSQMSQPSHHLKHDPIGCHVTENSVSQVSQPYTKCQAGELCRPKRFKKLLRSSDEEGRALA